MAQVAQSRKRGSSDWHYVGSGRTYYRSGPAVETFGEESLLARGKSWRGMWRSRCDQKQFAQRGEVSASDKKDMVEVVWLGCPLYEPWYEEVDCPQGGRSTWEMENGEKSSRRWWWCRRGGVRCELSMGMVLKL